MGIWRRLFGKRKQVVDLRGDRERQIESDANAGKSLGPEADVLVSELIEIGNSPGYLGSGEEFDGFEHIRTREIGERLNQLGGKDLMVAAYYRVRAEIGAGKARELESAWGHIGDWLP